MSDLDTINSRITATKARLAQNAREIQETRDKRDRDPFIFDARRQVLERVRDQIQQQLVNLDYERRCQLPAGGGADEWKPASGAVWNGSDH